MNTDPLVSICIPTYNRAGMVKSAIDSALAQSYENIEVLVVDNASNDDIESVITAYKDPRLKFFRNDKNLGIFGNFNRCIDLSKGKYIHILHSDDYIDSDFTKTCINFMESHPSVGMTFTSSEFISEAGTKQVSLYDHDLIFPAPKGFRMILEKGNPVVCPSVMIKREVYDLLGKYSCEFPFSADFYQWLKISQRYDIAFVADAILFYRMGQHSESFKLLYRSPIGYLDNIRILIRIIDELGADVESFRSEINIAIRGQMWDCLYAGTQRSDYMKSYSPFIFVAFSLNNWSLIRSGSISGQIKKCSEGIYLITIGFVVMIPGGHYILKRIFGIKESFC